MTKTSLHDPVRSELEGTEWERGRGEGFQSYAITRRRTRVRSNQTTREGENIGHFQPCIIVIIIISEDLEIIKV